VRCRGKATRDKDGKAIRMLGAHNNITALKKAEEKTQLLMKNRERFFARMSHEIRTPLHGILGITESLQDHNLDPFILSQLSTIIDCGKQLQHLLNDLLTISKIDEIFGGFRRRFFSSFICIHRFIV
jgi:signal transduction histidine kinase